MKRVNFSVMLHSYCRVSTSAESAKRDTKNNTKCVDRIKLLDKNTLKYEKC